ESEPVVEQPQGEQASLLDLAVGRMEGQGPEAHQVWLPPLDVPDTLDLLMPDLELDPQLGLVAPTWRRQGGLTVPLGTVDRPREQRRDVLTVNLLSAEESNIAPQAPQLTSAAPAAAAAPSRAQREFWRPVLLIGLAVLAVEWWVFYRGLRLPPPGAWRGAKEVRIYRRARREHREGTN
ncbi:MAG: hypothetical protein ACTHMU_09795, partial [Thermomicrobiales bacterium]